MCCFWSFKGIFNGLVFLSSISACIEFVYRSWFIWGCTRLVCNSYMPTRTGRVRFYRMSDFFYWWFTWTIKWYSLSRPFRSTSCLISSLNLKVIYSRILIVLVAWLCSLIFMWLHLTHRLHIILIWIPINTSSSVCVSSNIHNNVVMYFLDSHELFRLTVFGNFCF